MATYPFITKGTTVRIGASGTTIASGTDLKGVLIEDPVINVGEAENNTLTASDGTKYSFAGQEGDNDTSFVCVMTGDTITALMNSIYGVGTAGDAGSLTSTLWNLTSAGGTTKNIFFTPPTNEDGDAIKLIAVNAKGLSAKPKMALGTGWTVEVKYTCDKYQFQYDSNTSD